MKGPQCRLDLEANLAELKRRRDLEMLRVFLQHEHCFAPSANPDTAQINMDDLKKLARAWKLHERRNFWKLHAEKESMVAVLLQHAHETRKFDKVGGHAHAGAGKDSGGSAAGVAGAGAHQEHPGGDDSHSMTGNYPGGALPVPPRDPKPSATSPHPLGGATVRNFCGLQYFNREVLPDVLALQSRFDAAPEPSNTVDSLIDAWRSQNFSISKADDGAHEGRRSSLHSAKNSAKDKGLADGGGDSDGVGETKGESESQEARRQRDKKRQAERKKADEAEQKKASALAKRAKHRNLAHHLAFFSASDEFLRLRIADGGSRRGGGNDGHDDDDEDEEDDTSAKVRNELFPAPITPHHSPLPLALSLTHVEADEQELRRVVHGLGHENRANVRQRGRHGRPAGDVLLPPGAVQHRVSLRREEPPARDQRAAQAGHYAGARARLHRRLVRLPGLLLLLHRAGGRGG